MFSAGIRPRDELARDCGLAVGERGGVARRRALPHRGPATSTRSASAPRSTAGCYGLVAPGYAMAEVVADRLARRRRAAFTGADMSTKLKLLGVDVASFGDALGAPRARWTSSTPTRSRGVYKKLVVVRRRQTLLGGVLVGDASAYAHAAAAGRRGRCPATPSAAPARPAGGARPASALPDGAQVCSCHASPRARSAPRSPSRAAPTSPAVKACTKAGTGCGSLRAAAQDSCSPSGGVAASRKALCEHFDHSPRRSCSTSSGSRGIRTFSPSWSPQHGTRPRLRHLQAGGRLDPRLARRSGHVLDGEQAALQDTNDHFLANIQRNGTYSVVPRIPGGEITPEKLIVIGEVARDFGLYTKITGGQRIDLFGARVEQLPEIWRRLVDAGFESGHAYGKALRTVKSCVGSTWCRYGVQDSVGLAIDLELRYRGLRAPHKLKSAVSGCARECAEAREQGLRRHRHRERLEPLRRRQRRLPARATPTCSPRTSTTEDAGPATSTGS